MNKKNYEPTRRTLSYIRRMISTGIWKPGSRIPSIRKLSEKIFVSKATISKCIKQLIATGDLESQGSLGYSVRIQQIVTKIKDIRQADMIKLALFNTIIADKLQKGSVLIDDYLVLLDRAKLVAHLTNVKTNNEFTKTFEDLLKIAKTPIKINTILKYRGSKLKTARGELKEQIELFNVAGYVAKEIQ